MEQIQVQRFYETLALLIANKEGVDIKVTVTPRQDGQSGRQDGKKEQSWQRQQCKNKRTIVISSKKLGREECRRKERNESI